MNFPVIRIQLEQLKSSVVCANFFYDGEPAPYYPAYIIRSYGHRRVAFIGVLTPETIVKVFDHKSGEYLPLDLEKNYKVSLGVFYSSLGFYGMMKDCRIIRSVSDTTRDALEMYLMTVLKGQLGDSYKQPQSRITIVDD